MTDTTVTMTHAVTRELIDTLCVDGLTDDQATTKALHKLAEALDNAQGEERTQDRVVTIIIQPRE